MVCRCCVVQNRQKHSRKGKCWRWVCSRPPVSVSPALVWIGAKCALLTSSMLSKVDQKCFSALWGQFVWVLQWKIELAILPHSALAPNILGQFGFVREVCQTSHSIHEGNLAPTLILDSQCSVTYSSWKKIVETKNAFYEWRLFVHPEWRALAASIPSRGSGLLI